MSLTITAIIIGILFGGAWSLLVSVVTKKSSIFLTGGGNDCRRNRCRCRQPISNVWPSSLWNKHIPSNCWGNRFSRFTHLCIQQSGSLIETHEEQRQTRSFLCIHFIYKSLLCIFSIVFYVEDKTYLQQQNQSKEAVFVSLPQDSFLLPKAPLARFAS